MTAPVLVFAWGNPSRGDDALGPLFIEHFQALAARHPEWGEIDFLTDFQLQVEHALDLQGRQRVLFVDASSREADACSLQAIAPAKDASFSTHAMSPQAVMQVYTDIEDAAPPPCWLLGIRGESFELDAPLSEPARQALTAALEAAAAWLSSPT